MKLSPRAVIAVGQEETRLARELARTVAAVNLGQVLIDASKACRDLAVFSDIQALQMEEQAKAALDEELTAEHGPLIEQARELKKLWLEAAQSQIDEALRLTELGLALAQLERAL